jgi:hypothetical protein
MTLYGLHIGINKYPRGNALKKCVADARGVQSLFDGQLLLDKRAKPDELLGQLHETCSLPAAGEWGVISYSGHGTPVDDENGDEPDGQDEAIVAVTLEPVIDDEIQQAMRGRHRKARILLIADSCYSGMVHRAIPVLSRRYAPSIRKQRMRYLPPSLAKHRKATVQCQGDQDALPNVVVFSGCTDFEYSYEGDHYGAWTGSLLKTYAPELTIGQWFNAARRAMLETEFGSIQHPQLICSAAAKRWKVPSR